MSRARTRKQEEKIDFLTQNPELIEYDTHLSVVPDGGGFTVEAKDGLGQPLPVFLTELGPGLVSTLVREVELVDGTLSVTAPVPSDPFLEPFISLNDDGFGVFSENDVPIKETGTLNDGEALGFEFFGPFALVSTLNGGPPAFGITDLLIEYEVLNNGAGTIELQLENAPSPVVYVGNGLPGPTPPEVVQVDSGSKNTTGHIEVDAAPGMAFGGWDLTVEGNVQIAVTGISYGTEHGFVEPF